jgi:hypothetical protein
MLERLLLCHKRCVVSLVAEIHHATCMNSIPTIVLTVLFCVPPRSPTQRSATVVHVRIATSLISSAQALVNLRRELRPKKGFDAVALDAKMVWNR